MYSTNTFPASYIVCIATIILCTSFFFAHFRTIAWTVKKSIEITWIFHYWKCSSFAEWKRRRVEMDVHVPHFDWQDSTPKSNAKEFVLFPINYYFLVIAVENNYRVVRTCTWSECMQLILVIINLRLCFSAATSVVHCEIFEKV